MRKRRVEPEVGVVVAVTIFVIGLVVLFFAAYGSTSNDCEEAGGHLRSYGKATWLCISEDGRILEDY